MPVTEVQWIGASCGRHSSYTFYKGFRLIVDGVEKNFCLGEFYFVRNSTNQPICIAELQLVWHDASTDNQLASARLYFRPEDTPIGRLPNHGQDELLYADQKVVIKCHDMARWQDSGIQWNSGIIPLYESDFVCINDRYYLDSHYVDKEKERKLKATESWKSGDQPRSLQILTFSAYCRYRALKKRLLAGACLTKAQLVALGGVLGDRTRQRVLFCRDSFHHPYLDKFELAGDNKAPVLKGRPRKKKNLIAAKTSVLRKKRIVGGIQNHATNPPAAKRCKISEEEESAGSDMSEGVLERVKVPPAAPRVVENNAPPPLVKPIVQVISKKPPDVPKAAVANVLVTNPKAPPPLIPSDKLKGVPVTVKLSLEQVNLKANECSRTTPMQKQIFSTDAKLRKADQLNNDKINSAVLVKSHLSDAVKPSLTSASLASVHSSSESKTVNILNSSMRSSHGSNLPAKTDTNTNSTEHLRTIIPAVQAEARPHSSSATRPVASTQGTVGTQSAVSVSPAVRTQPVASLPQTVSSAHTIMSKTHQHVTPLTESVSTTVKASVGLSTGDLLFVKARHSKENEDQQFSLAPNGKKEYEKAQTEEAVAWKKKMKRLRMPGNVKDEEYEDEDEKYFMQTLRDFMRKTNQPLGKLPALGFKKVNLWTMYNTAQRFGGYDAVTSKRLWRRVYDSLGGSATITSAATYTRRHYERLLLPYERHIQSQLKKQIDEKNATHVESPAPKEAPNKAEKKQGLAVSNSNPKPSLCPNTDKTVAVKQTEEANPERIQRSDTALSSPPVPSVRISVSSDAKRTAVKTTDSVQPVFAVTTSVTENPSPVPIKSFKRQEPSSRNDEEKVTSSQPSALRTAKGDVIPSEPFQGASNQQISEYRVKTTSNDEEASARTNTIYTKKAAAVGGNSEQSHHGAALQRVAHDGTPLSSQPKKINTPGKGREIIDLTSEDSPPQSQVRGQSLPHVQTSQANLLEKPQVPRLVSERDTDGGRRHTSKSHLRKEFNDGSLRHQLNSEVRSSIEMSPVYDKQAYSSKPQAKPKIPDSSPVTRMDSMERRFTHSPSLDSVDEHFAEWRRRQSSIPQQNVSHQRQPCPERSKLRYNYIKEEICPLDCSCSLPTSRKDEIMSVPPPKPKKEHYEEDLPFPGVTLYPGRWSPTMIAADHPDLYFSSHAPHLPSPQDSLASHMCTASRIFLPTAPIFSPPYHLGMPPMGGGPLITGTDDQLHIHPHLLMGSSYPCTSNTRTPDGTPYLYTYT